MTNVPEERTSEEIQSAIKIDGDAVRGHLDELVRSTVEETLNNLLDAEADQLCGAKRYERSADRVDTRAVAVVAGFRGVGCGTGRMQGPAGPAGRRRPARTGRRRPFAYSASVNPTEPSPLIEISTLRT